MQTRQSGPATAHTPRRTLTIRRKRRCPDSSANGSAPSWVSCSASPPRRQFAGEWVKVVSQEEGWNAIGYKGKFYEGEYATLLYKTSGEKNFSGDSRKVYYKLGMLLNNGDAAITGFTGVELVSKNSDGAVKNLLTLSQGPHRDSLGELAGSYDAGAHGGVAHRWDRIYDWHACFRTRPSEIDSTLSVSCDSGEGRWIYVETRGSLYEKRPHAISHDCWWNWAKVGWVREDGTVDEICSPGPRIGAATRLSVGAKNGEYTSFNLTIDDAFRHALWDENFWGKK